MLPRIQSQLDGSVNDEWFENSKDGWICAWDRFNQLILSKAAYLHGKVVFEYCGHLSNPPQSCVIIEEESWGDEN